MGYMGDRSLRALLGWVPPIFTILLPQFWACRTSTNAWVGLGIGCSFPTNTVFVLGSVGCNQHLKAGAGCLGLPLSTCHLR